MQTKWLFLWIVMEDSSWVGSGKAWLALQYPSPPQKNDHGRLPSSNTSELPKIAWNIRLRLFYTWILVWANQPTRKFSGQFFVGCSPMPLSKLDQDPRWQVSKVLKQFGWNKRFFVIFDHIGAIKVFKKNQMAQNKTNMAWNPYCGVKKPYLNQNGLPFGTPGAPKGLFFLPRESLLGARLVPIATGGLHPKQLLGLPKISVLALRGPFRSKRASSGALDVPEQPRQGVATQRQGH